MDDFKMSIDYLPIGTAVKLKEGKTVVIMGYFVTDEDVTDVYDYCGCLYPEGFDEVSDMFLFDEDQIDEVLYVGYDNEEGQKYRADMAKEIDDAYSDLDDEEDDGSDTEEETEEESKDDNEINLVSLDKIERL